MDFSGAGSWLEATSGEPTASRAGFRLFHGRSAETKFCGEGKGLSNQRSSLGFNRVNPSKQEVFSKKPTVPERNLPGKQILNKNGQPVPDDRARLYHW